MAKEKKFSFIPENQLNLPANRSILETVTISKKGLLTFSTSFTENYQLKNKHIRFYADPQKKAVAWTIFDNQEIANNSNIKLRKLVPYEPRGEIKLSIAKILSSIGVKTEKPRLKIPVKKYEDILERKTFFYVDLS